DLVELRESELVRTIDDERVRIRNVETAFNNGGGHEDVHLTIHEAAHDLLELLLLHLPVADLDLRVRYQPLHPLSEGVDRLDTVVDEEDLAAAVHLASDGIFDDGVRPGQHVRDDRLAI